MTARHAAEPSLLAGRTAIITGAADGIGWAIARTFGAHGANVVVADVRGAAADARTTELQGQGIPSISVACDVTVEDDVTNLTARTTAEFGRVDVFVNNAGVTRDAVLRNMSVEDFKLVMDVHVLGAWLGTRAAVAAMRTNGIGGSIVNMSSISGKVGNAGQSNYSAAKAAIVGLTKATAKEVARYGIRVNAIQPGLIRTAMTASMDQQALAAGLAQVPLGRIGEPEDIANVATFLASDLSSYVTGTVLEVTGGRHM